MVIRFSPYNMVLLLPSVMLLLRGARHLWRKNWIYRLFCSITALTVFWSFLSAAVLVIALAFVPETIEQKAWAVPFYPIYIMPIMVYALLLVFKEVLCAGAVPKPAE
jgi:lysylphosphatidylglycerol synthetase-like protein (DUF2156 family)